MCSHRSRSLIAGVIGVMLYGMAHAETAAEKIMRINEEIAVLSAQLSKAQLEEKLAKSLATTSGGGSQVSAAMDVKEDLPVVRGIEGIDGKLSARLVGRGGVEQIVRVGEKYGVFLVKTITVNSVVITRGSEVHQLSFGNEPAATRASTVGANGASLPSPGFPGTGIDGTVR